MQKLGERPITDMKADDLKYTVPSNGYAEALPKDQENRCSADTVCIVVEAVDVEMDEAESGTNNSVDTTSGSSMVKTLMDLAELRKEAFVRLLEEHAEIVREIKKAETASQT